MTWNLRAACREMDTELWFALPGSIDRKQALAICAQCPVRTECLADAIEQGEVEGIRGGVDMATLPARDRYDKAA